MELLAEGIERAVRIDVDGDEGALPGPRLWPTTRRCMKRIRAQGPVTEP